MNCARLEHQAVVVAVPRNDLLPARGSQGGRIVTDLHGEVEQRGNYRDTTDEVAEITENVENSRLPPPNGSAFSGI